MPDLFPLIARQRLAVVDLLGTLSDPEWATPSLCTGWTVREVAAHLLMPFEVGLPRMAWRMVKARGDFNRVADSFARANTWAPARLVSTLRANAEHRFTPPGLGPEAPLTDIVTHGLDIGVPVDRCPPLPADTANEVLAFLVTDKAARAMGRKGLADDLRFSSADTDWSAGRGAVVSGAAASLILALTGRRTGLDGLTGDGLPELTARLA